MPNAFSELNHPEEVNPPRFKGTRKAKGSVKEEL